MNPMESRFSENPRIISIHLKNCFNCKKIPNKVRDFQSYTINAALFFISALAFELNLSVDQSNQSIVTSDSDVCSRMDFCAALTNQDIPR